MNYNNLKPGKSALFVFMLFGMAALISCRSGNGEDTGYKKLVKTAKVAKIPSEITKQFPAVVEEAEEVNLAFRVAGPIQKIYVKEGEYVKKGQLVAEMDSRDYEVQKKAVEAQVTQLQSEYKRVKELKERKSVSDNDFEKMKAGKEMAEAKLKNAIDQLKDTKLYAPFSGYITRVMFENGELVNHGTPIVSVIDVSQLKVEINVPSSLYIDKDNISKIECVQADIPDKTFPLFLYANNIKANNNGLYKFYLYYKPAPGSKLAPGMNVSVHVHITHPGPELLKIPAKALFEKEGKSYVWVVKDSKVKLRKITTNNSIQNGSIVIVNGLKEGEEVVTGGLNLLSEDEKVKVIAPASKSNIGNIL